MKINFVGVVVLFVLAAVGARAGVTLLGHGPSGSVYQYTGPSYGPNSVSGYQVHYGEELGTQTYVQNWSTYPTEDYNSVDTPVVTGTFTVPVGQSWEYYENARYGYTMGGVGAHTWRYNVTNLAVSQVGTYGPGMLGTNKKVSFTYTNETGAGQWIGLENVTDAGKVFQVQFVGPGETYTGGLSLDAANASTYRMVAVDADTAFASGGGSVTYWENPDGTKTYDFSGHVSAIGGAKGYADGTAVGQTVAGSSPPPVTSGAGISAPSGIVANPRYVSTGGVSGTVTSATAGSGVTQGNAAANTNAITAALNDVRKAVIASGGGGGGGTDMSGVHSRLDTANTHLTAVEQILTGAHATQLAFDNAHKLSVGVASAGAVTPYAGLKPTVGGPLSVSIPGSESTDWGSVQVAGTTLTFGVSRMSSQMDGLMVAGRSVLLAAMCLGFMRASSKTLTQYTVAMPQVLAQDTGFGPENIGPGVSQAKTYATAAFAVGTIFTGVAAIVAVVDTMVTYYGGGVAQIFAAINFPAASVAGQLDRFVPLAAGLGLTVMSVALPFVVAPMYLATAAILRFVKT